MSHYNHIKINK